MQIIIIVQFSFVPKMENISCYKIFNPLFASNLSNSPRYTKSRERETYNPPQSLLTAKDSITTSDV